MAGRPARWVHCLLSRRRSYRLPHWSKTLRGVSCGPFRRLNLPSGLTAQQGDVAPKQCSTWLRNHQAYLQCRQALCNLYPHKAGRRGKVLSARKIASTNCISCILQDALGPRIHCCHAHLEFEAPFSVGAILCGRSRTKVKLYVLDLQLASASSAGHEQARASCLRV